MTRIPALDQNGLLPPGVHACTIEEVEERFGRFQTSDRRVELTRKLKAYLFELRRVGLVDRVVVDGSYVTGKDEPEDVDLIVVLRASYDFTLELRPDHYNAVSRRRVKKAFGLDVMVAPEGSEMLMRHLEYFQHTRAGRTKGLLEVQP